MPRKLLATVNAQLPSFIRPLRYYQEDTVGATLEALKTHRSALVVMATGLGKTECFAEMARLEKGRTIIFADRDELVGQAIQRIEGRLGGEPVFLEQGPIRASHFARVVVASTRTMMNRLDFWPRDHFDLVIVDETDCYMAPGYRRTIEHFTGKRAGFTATADRGDGKGLKPLYKTVVTEGCMDLFEGIEAGFLCPVRCSRVALKEVNLDAMGSVAGDFVRRELDAAMMKEILGITEYLVDRDAGRKGVLFTPGVATAEVAHLAFQNHLIPSCFLRDKMDKKERREAVERFRDGRNHWLTNCMIAIRGFDAPLTSCIGLARPSRSRNLVAQMVGRGTRVFPGCVDRLLGREQAPERRAAIAASPKPDCMLRDFAGVSRRPDFLVGPEDVLGKFTPEERAEAKKLIKERPESDVREALLEAKTRLRRAVAQVKLDIKVDESEAFDPFAVIGLRFATSKRKHNGWGAPITPGMKVALEGIGLEKDYVAGLSKAAGGKLLTEFSRRRKLCLVSFKMLRLLRKFGVDDFNLPFHRGQEACRYIDKDCGYGRRKPVEHQRLTEILYGPREPGEDG